MDLHVGGLTNYNNLLFSLSLILFFTIIFLITSTEMIMYDMVMNFRCKSLLFNPDFRYTSKPLLLSQCEKLLFSRSHDPMQFS